jgi:hypothetical protein
VGFKSIAASITSLCVNTLGDEVTYTPSAGAPVTLQGVFEHAWLEVEGINTLKPILRIAVADLVALPAKGDAVSIDSVWYAVHESHLDGNGGATLFLRKV